MEIQELYKIKLPQYQLEELLINLLDGLPIIKAFRTTNISEYYYNKWLKLYNAYVDDYNANNNNGSLLYESCIKISNIGDTLRIELLNSKVNAISFIYAIKVCCALCEKQYIKMLKECTRESDDWRKFSWFLERRFKDDFGIKEKEIESNKAAVDKIKVIFVDAKDSDDRLKKLDEEVRKTINAN